MNRGNMTRQITEVPMKGSKKGYMNGGMVAGGGMGRPAMGMGYKSGGKVSADMVSPRKAMAMGLKPGAKKGKK
jgi:hypothetical protein